MRLPASPYGVALRINVSMLHSRRTARECCWHTLICRSMAKPLHVVQKASMAGDFDQAADKRRDVLRGQPGRPALTNFSGHGVAHFTTYRRRRCETLIRQLTSGRRC